MLESPGCRAPEGAGTSLSANPDTFTDWVCSEAVPVTDRPEVPDTLTD